MNQLNPPFDNPAIRRALSAPSISRSSCRRPAGDDRSFWRDQVGYFCPNTPMASDAGMEALTGKRDLARVKSDLAAAGYKGEKVTLLGATDIPVLKALADVTADLLHRVGMNVDYVATDWGTLVQRRTRKQAGPGGWHLYSNFGGGLDMTTPITHSALWSGSNAAPGWPHSPRIEALSADWLSAPDPAARKAIARDIQRQAFIDVPYIPLGQLLQPTAYRRDIHGVMGGFPVFWNIARA